MDDVTVTIISPELGIKKRIGPFDLDKNEDTTRTLLLEMPYYVEPGIYDLRITISNDKYRRVRHRPIVIT
ncbi:hypothetical protein J4209_02635 [Candidatus Woesearchaeota archaeon]|nr:hypothetical protein [Candidatus Woesearchaeota archaeon]